MSLLNDPDALPSGFRTVCRFLHWSGGSIDEIDLIDAISPAALRETGDDVQQMRKQTSNLLREMTTLGLISREGERVALGDDVPGLASDTQEDRVRFRAFVRRRILGGDDEITRILAWLFMQDLYSVPGFDLDSAGRLNLERIGSAGKLNDVKWKNLERWAVWMGLAWTYRKTLIPDPSAALAEELSHLFADSEGVELPVERFLDRVAEALPVVDRGAVFRAVREEYGEAADDETLSFALSLAFGCLEDGGRIRGEHRADSAGIVRIRRSSTASTTVTHVVLTAVEAP